MATKWTDKQEKVIETRGRNILVSAAAGSGKTSVLVERIIRKITDKNNPIDVDRLLVVTFTNAAASEMRERVFDALAKTAELEPYNEHIQKQLTYIHNAKITTIDSFCASIFKEYFDRIDVDPNMRIVDKAELGMLEADVMEEMLEEYYSNGDENFFKVADSYNSANNMSVLNEIISKLYASARAHIMPKKWLEQCKEVYSVRTISDANESLWMKYLMIGIEDTINHLKNILNEAIIISKMEGGPSGYIPELERLTAILNVLCDGDDFDKIYKTIHLLDFDARIASPGKAEPKLKIKAQNLRNQAKDIVNSLKTGVFEQNIEDYIAELKKVKPVVETIVDLTLDFMERFEAAKKEKCIIDFLDMEHFALSILVDMSEDGTYKPSKVARDIATQYEEVMIDEYQDSNYIQDAILSSVSRGMDINNMFMVGDVKQSIYKFRLAKPELFIEKYNTYDNNLDADSCKIILDKNFRSRKEIINSVNYIFSCLMNKELGGIEYVDGNQLEQGRDFPKLPSGQNNSTELIIIEDGNLEEESKFIASKIHELLDAENGFMVTDGDTMRKARLRDIVILLRSTKDTGEKMAKYLCEEGINAYCPTATGYYDAKEVKMVLDYLVIIDNPLQDIPLAAVMTSEMYNFTSEDLAKLKIKNKKYYLYDSLKLYGENGDDSELLSKINKFLADLIEYRKIAPYTSVYDIITRILEDTGYGVYVSALPGGIRRMKNIEILKEKAIDYATTTYKGLFNFVRYIDKIRELKVEEGEASEINESDDIVRIMTFHKSKGLQFPIVFVSRLGTKFNMLDLTNNVLIHEKYGLGVDLIDEKLRVKGGTILKQTIGNAIKEDIYAENVRLLYVAMTRAQDKMFLTGSLKKTPEKIIELADKTDARQNKVSAYELMSQISFIEWIIMAISKNKAFMGVATELEYSLDTSFDVFNIDSDISVNINCKEQSEEILIKNKIITGIKKEEMVNWDADIIYDESTNEEIRNNLLWEYPYNSLYRIPAKLSVTEIKKLSMEHNEEEDGDREIEKYVTDMEPLLPEYLKSEDEKILKGALRGTAYHRIFELFDFNMEPTYANIENMLKVLLNNKKIGKDIYDCINVKDFEKFAECNLYERMKRADEEGVLYRERSFLMGVNANELEIYKDCGTDEMILVQGIIDACFIENNNYVIVDYKTDNVSCLEELAELYKAQLISYKDAIEKIDDIKVSELIIYSVKFGKQINIKF